MDGLLQRNLQCRNHRLGCIDLGFGAGDVEIGGQAGSETGAVSSRVSRCDLMLSLAM